jgi:hypothetical protein
MMMNGYEVHRVRQEQKKDQLRHAARWRLVRQAGLVHGLQVRQSACWLLCQLGRALVSFGERLERHGEPRLAAH